MDKEVNTWGLGTTTKKQKGGKTQIYAAVVFVKQPDFDKNADMQTQALKLLNDTRIKKGLHELARDPALEQLAFGHSKELASLEKLTEISPTRGSVVDAALEEVEADEAAADVFLIDTLEPLASTENALGDFSRVGIGVYREEKKQGPQLWVTVLYTLHDDF